MNKNEQPRQAARRLPGLFVFVHFLLDRLRKNSYTSPKAQNEPDRSPRNDERRTGRPKRKPHRNLLLLCPRRRSPAQRTGKAPDLPAKTRYYRRLARPPDQRRNRMGTRD